MDFKNSGIENVDQAEKKFFEEQVKKIHKHTDNSPIELTKVEDDGTTKSEIESLVESARMSSNDAPPPSDGASAEYLGETEGNGASNDWQCSCGAVFHSSNGEKGPEIKYKSDKASKGDGYSGSGKSQGYGSEESSGYGSDQKPNY